MKEIFGVQKMENSTGKATVIFYLLEGSKIFGHWMQVAYVSLEMVNYDVGLTETFGAFDV